MEPLHEFRVYSLHVASEGCLPQEKCDEMSDRYIAQCRKNAEERPRGVEAWIDLGDALIFRDRWAEAEDAYAKASKRFRWLTQVSS